MRSLFTIGAVLLLGASLSVHFAQGALEGGTGSEPVRYGQGSYYTQASYVSSPGSWSPSFSEVSNFSNSYNQGTYYGQGGYYSQGSYSYGQGSYSASTYTDTNSYTPSIESLTSGGSNSYSPGDVSNGSGGYTPGTTQLSTDSSGNWTSGGNSNLESLASGNSGGGWSPSESLLSGGGGSGSSNNSWSYTESGTGNSTPAPSCGLVCSTVQSMTGMTISQAIETAKDAYEIGSKVIAAAYKTIGQEPPAFTTLPTTGTAPVITRGIPSGSVPTPTQSTQVATEPPPQFVLEQFMTQKAIEGGATYDASTAAQREAYAIGELSGLDTDSPAVRAAINLSLEANNNNAQRAVNAITAPAKVTGADPNTTITNNIALFDRTDFGSEGCYDRECDAADQLGDLGITQEALKTEMAAISSRERAELEARKDADLAPDAPQRTTITTAPQQPTLNCTGSLCNQEGVQVAYMGDDYDSLFDAPKTPVPTAPLQYDADRRLAALNNKVIDENKTKEILEAAKREFNTTYLNASEEATLRVLASNRSPEEVTQLINSLDDGTAEGSYRVALFKAARGIENTDNPILNLSDEEVRKIEVLSAEIEAAKSKATEYSSVNSFNTARVGATNIVSTPATGDGVVNNGTVATYLPSGYTMDNGGNIVPVNPMIALIPEAELPKAPEAPKPQSFRDMVLGAIFVDAPVALGHEAVSFVVDDCFGFCVKPEPEPDPFAVFDTLEVQNRRNTFSETGDYMQTFAAQKAAETINTLGLQPGAPYDSLYLERERLRQESATVQQSYQNIRVAAAVAQESECGMFSVSCHVSNIVTPAPAGPRISTAEAIAAQQKEARVYAGTNEAFRALEALHDAKEAAEITYTSAGVTPGDDTRITIDEYTDGLTDAAGINYVRSKEAALNGNAAASAWYADLAVIAAETNSKLALATPEEKAAVEANLNADATIMADLFAASTQDAGTFNVYNLTPFTAAVYGLGPEPSEEQLTKIGQALAGESESEVVNAIAKDYLSGNMSDEDVAAAMGVLGVYITRGVANEGYMGSCGVNGCNGDIARAISDLDAFKPFAIDTTLTNYNLGTVAGDDGNVNAFVEFARDALNGTIAAERGIAVANPTPGSTHYLNPDVSDPTWDDPDLRVAENVGSHDFYKLTGEYGYIGSPIYVGEEQQGMYDRAVAAINDQEFYEWDGSADIQVASSDERPQSQQTINNPVLQVLEDLAGADDAADTPKTAYAPEVGVGTGKLLPPTIVRTIPIGPDGQPILTVDVVTPPANRNLPSASENIAQARAEQQVQRVLAIRDESVTAAFNAAEQSKAALEKLDADKSATQAERDVAAEASYDAWQAYIKTTEAAKTLDPQITRYVAEANTAAKTAIGLVEQRAQQNVNDDLVKWAEQEQAQQDEDAKRIETALRERLATEQAEEPVTTAQIPGPWEVATGVIGNELGKLGSALCVWCEKTTVVATPQVPPTKVLTAAEMELVKKQEEAMQAELAAERARVASNNAYDPFAPGGPANTQTLDAARRQAEAQRLAQLQAVNFDELYTPSSYEVLDTNVFQDELQKYAAAQARAAEVSATDAERAAVAARKDQDVLIGLDAYAATKERQAQVAAQQAEAAAIAERKDNDVIEGLNAYAAKKEIEAQAAADAQYVAYQQRDQDAIQGLELYAAQKESEARLAQAQARAAAIAERKDNDVIEGLNAYAAMKVAEAQAAEEARYLAEARIKAAEQRDNDAILGLDLYTAQQAQKAAQDKFLELRVAAAQTNSEGCGFDLFCRVGITEPKPAPVVIQPGFASDRTFAELAQKHELTYEKLAEIDVVVKYNPAYKTMADMMLNNGKTPDQVVEVFKTIEDRDRGSSADVIAEIFVGLPDRASDCTTQACRDTFVISEASGVTPETYTKLFAGEITTDAEADIQVAQSTPVAPASSEELYEQMKKYLDTASDGAIALIQKVSPNCFGLCIKEEPEVKVTYSPLPIVTTPQVPKPAEEVVTPAPSPEPDPDMQLGSDEVIGILGVNKIYTGSEQVVKDSTTPQISVWQSTDGGTDLSGLRVGTVDAMIDLKDSCNCNITVTGAAEATGNDTDGGDFSHANGYKFDVRTKDNPDVVEYVKALEPIGTNQYRDPEKPNVVYTVNSNNIDVTVFPPDVDPRG